MKGLKLLTIMMLFFASMSLNAQDKKLKANEAEVLYSVSIHCASCVTKLNAKLPYLRNIKDFKVNMADQTIWFLYKKNKTDVEKLAKELDKLGYPAEVVNSTTGVPKESK